MKTTLNDVAGLITLHQNTTAESAPMPHLFSPRKVRPRRWDDSVDHTDDPMNGIYPATTNGQFELYYTPTGGAKAKHSALHRCIQIGMDARKIGPPILHNAPLDSPRKGWELSLNSAVASSVAAECGIPIQHRGHSSIYERQQKDSPQARTCYYAAQDAMAAYGHASFRRRLKRAQTFIRKQGFAAAAETLPHLINAAVSAARMRQDTRAYISRFIELYGSPQSPPKPPEPESPPLGSPSLDDLLKKEGEWRPQPLTLKPGRPRWGLAKVVYPRLSVNLTASILKQKRHKRCMSGVFRYPWRALETSDFHAFSVKRPLPGGTIIVDCSGSMNFTHKDIQNILNTTPAATIALYGGVERTTSGNITVVAKDGMAVDEDTLSEIMDLFDGQNLIDGPALEWVASQTAPRVWISDGLVFGYHDGGSESISLAMAQQCDAWTRTARITRVPSAGHLIQLLSGYSGDLPEILSVQETLQNHGYIKGMGGLK